MVGSHAVLEGIKHIWDRVKAPTGSIITAAGICGMISVTSSVGRKVLSNKKIFKSTQFPKICKATHN